MSLVSVIIPTKNRISLLKTTLKSIFKQSYPHIETIVINDGGGDNTAEYCKSLNRVRYLNNDTGLSGPSRARNIGMEHAKGNYLLFLDDDDLIHPEHVSEMVKEAEKLGTKYVPSSRWILFQMDQDGIFFGDKISFKGEKSFSGSIAGMIDPAISDNIINSSFLWRKSQIDSIRWNEELFTNGDLDFYMQALMIGLRFYGVDGGYVYYRSHDGIRVAGTKSVRGLESSARHRFLWSEKLKDYKDDPKVRKAFCNSFMSLIINWVEVGDYRMVSELREKMIEWGCRSFFLPIQPRDKNKAFLANTMISFLGMFGLKIIVRHLKKSTKPMVLSSNSDYHKKIIDGIYSHVPIINLQ